MNLELETVDTKKFENSLSDTLNQEQIANELKETLQKTDLILKMYLKDGNTIGIESVNSQVQPEKALSTNKTIRGVQEELTLNKTNNKSQKAGSVSDIVLQKVEKFPKKIWVRKAIRIALKTGEELLDNVARETLKKELKWNYSVYNDAKSAALAIYNKDYKKAMQKGTDSIMYIIDNKNISATAKKVLKNTKNVAIDEAFRVNET